MKKLRCVCLGLAILLSDVMCAAVAWNYGKMLWGVEKAGYSAPASVALLGAIPFLIGILICLALALFFHKKAGRQAP